MEPMNLETFSLRENTTRRKLVNDLITYVSLPDDQKTNELRSQAKRGIKCAHTRIAELDEQIGRLNELRTRIEEEQDRIRDAVDRFGPRPAQNYGCQS